MKLKIIALAALISTGIIFYACKKDEVSQIQNSSAISKKNASNCMDLFEPMINDVTLPKEKIITAILGKENICDEVLEEVINCSTRIFDERDIKIIMVGKSPLSDNVLSKLLQCGNPNVTDAVIEKVLSYNLTLGQAISSELSKYRPNVQIPLPSKEFTEWYTENVNRLDEVTRDEITKFEVRETQVEIFKALSPEKKAEMFLEKYDDLISSGLYSGEKLAYIERSKDFISADSFKERTGKQRVPSNHGEIVIHTKEGPNHFEFYELSIILNELGDIISPRASGGFGSSLGGGGGGIPCECSTQSDWCADPGKCYSTRCNIESSSGCGTFWKYSCGGKCAVFPY